MGLEFHQRLRDGFKEIAATEAARCRVIDADGDVETVTERVIAAVEASIAGQGA